MSAIFVTSFSEAELKEFLKTALKEILSEGIEKLKPEEAQPLDIREAAKLLKLQVTTLYEKTCRKIIPHFKRGNKLYFHKEDLLAWIKGGKVRTQEETANQAMSYLLKRNKSRL